MATLVKYLGTSAGLEDLRNKSLMVFMLEQLLITATEEINLAESDFFKNSPQK